MTAATHCLTWPRLGRHQPEEWASSIGFDGTYLAGEETRTAQQAAAGFKVPATRLRGDPAATGRKGEITLSSLLQNQDLTTIVD
jgi:hypothetical protein